MAEGRKVLVKSFSNLGTSYEVDLDRQSCTCPAFRKRPSQPCKHVRSFDGLFFEPPVPDPNEALSALIKAIRLRRTEDAVMWLLYLWRIPSHRVRAQRRLLIASAEDNLSVGVMRKTSAWYNSLERVRFDSAAAEVIRICMTPNWWAQADGHAYMDSWLEAEQDVPSLEVVGEDSLYAKVEEAAYARDLKGALGAFAGLYSRVRVVPNRIAAILSAVAHASGSSHARRLAALYHANVRTLGPDGNLAGQALYVALVGRLGDQATPEPSPQEVRRLVGLARARLAADPKVPAWALDGIHTGRVGDPRFAGTVRRMVACCRAFRHYCRLAVEDPWLPSFMEGL